MALIALSIGLGGAGWLLSMFVGPMLIFLAIGSAIAFILTPITYLADRVYMNRFIVDSWVWLSGRTDKNIIVTCNNNATSHILVNLFFAVFAWLGLIVIAALGLVAIVCVAGAYLAPIAGAILSIAIFFDKSPLDVGDKTAWWWNSKNALGAGFITAGVLLTPMIAVGLLIRLDHAISLIGC